MIFFVIFLGDRLLFSRGCKHFVYTPFPPAKGSFGISAATSFFPRNPLMRLAAFAFCIFPHVNFSLICPVFFLNNSPLFLFFLSLHASLFCTQPISHVFDCFCFFPSPLSAISAMGLDFPLRFVPFGSRQDRVQTSAKLG